MHLGNCMWENIYLHQQYKIKHYDLKIQIVKLEKELFIYGLYTILDPMSVLHMFSIL